jgi:type IV pilus assembly protein PilC
MPEFEYTGASRDQFKTGSIFAGSEEEAQTVLSEQGISVVSLRVRRPLEFGFLSLPLSRFQTQMREQMSAADKILFTSQLSSMIKAGLPMIDALATFVDEKSRSGSAVVINKIMQDVQSGMKLSDSLVKFPKIFNPAYLAIVRAGEGSGTLDDSLGYLSELLRRENALLTKVRSALIYPTVVVIAMISVMTFISVSILPKILTFAESSGQKLPIYTLVLVGMVSFLTSYWYVVLIVLILLIIGGVIFSKGEFGSRWIGKISLKLPVAGIVVSRYNQARFARVLGGFYTYGVNIVTSFDILAQSLDNPLYRDACVRIKERLTLGQSLADAIGEEHELFPTIMTRLIKGAEKTGDIGTTLDKLAHYYEEELENVLANILALIEPIMVFVLGFGVLGLAMAVILPIYQVTSSIK